MENIKYAFDRESNYCVHNPVREFYVLASREVKNKDNDVKNKVNDVKNKVNMLSKICIIFSTIFVAILLGGYIGYLYDASNANKLIEYSVGAGDSLWSVASESGNDTQLDYKIEQIKYINGIKDNRLQVGQVLLVPHE